MRTSPDIYKLPNNTLIFIDGTMTPPANSKLWSGYDYDRQLWIFKGKAENRTIDQMKIYNTKRTKIINKAVTTAILSFEA